MPRTHVGELVHFAAPGGGDVGEVVHLAGRAIVARRRRGDPILVVLVALNGWRYSARYAPQELNEAISHAVAYAAGRRL